MRIGSKGKGIGMPRSYAPEFRRRVVELVRSGRSLGVVAAEIGVSEAMVYRWRGAGSDRPGCASWAVECGALGAGAGAAADPGAGDGARDHQEGFGAVRRGGGAPKSKYPVIASLAGRGFEIKRCCRILGVAPSEYFGWRRRSPTPSELRREWLRGLISQIQADSRGVYGYRRVRRSCSLAARSSSHGSSCTS